MQTDGDHARWVDNSNLAWALLALLNPAAESSGMRVTSVLFISVVEEHPVKISFRQSPAMIS